MTRKGFLVLGPESSGTKLTAELLRRAGCRSIGVLGGDDDPGPDAPADDARPPLIRRSFPHGTVWSAIPDLVALLDADAAHAVVTSRDWFAMVDSQTSRRLAADRETAFANIRRAYHHIFTGIGALGIPFLVSSYEAMTAQPDYPLRLLDSLGLGPAAVETYDANTKWYRDEQPMTGPPPGAWTAGQPAWRT